MSSTLAITMKSSVVKKQLPLESLAYYFVGSCYTPGRKLPTFVSQEAFNKYGHAAYV